MFRAAIIVIAASCAATATPLLAQQAQDLARVAPATAARDSSTNTTQAGPRVSPLFQTAETRLAGSNAPVRQEGGQNTIVISTLALVLIVIIVVLLIR